jgi:hypothetical protein
MSHLNTIFAVWDDNAEALAADIGEKGVTVRQWRNRGDIPSRSAQLKIIRAAFEKDGTVLRLEDFLSPDERRSLPVHDHAGPDNGERCSVSATKSPSNIAAPAHEWPVADNSPENIREEADSPGPFSEGSPSTSLTTSGPQNTLPDSATSSPSATARAA